MHTFLLHNLRWSCIGLIFLPGSKEFSQLIHPFKRYCSFSVASRAKRSETQRRHYFFRHQHKRFWHQQKIIYCHAYTGYEEAWPVHMQLAPIFQIPCKPFIFIAVLPINLQYKLDYGCRWGYLPYRPGENQKLRFLNRHFSTQEMAVHITQRRNECTIQWHRQQSILTS